MAQRATFRRPHQVDKQFALKRQAIVKFALGSRLNRINTFQRSREVFGHALDHIARKLEVSVAIAVLTRQVTYQRQRACVSDGLGKRQRLLRQ